MLLNPVKKLDLSFTQKALQKNPLEIIPKDSHEKKPIAKTQAINVLMPKNESLDKNESSMDPSSMFQVP